MAATAVPDTGHGASVTFGTTSWSGKLIAIPTNLKERLEPVETSYLGITAGNPKTFMAGDLKDVGEIELDVRFEGVTGLPSPTQTAETVTITFPLPAGGAAVAPNIAGTALIIGRDFPAMQTGTLQQGKIIIKFDGTTGPTYTVAS